MTLHGDSYRGVSWDGFIYASRDAVGSGTKLDGVPPYVGVRWDWRAGFGAGGWKQRVLLCCRRQDQPAGLSWALVLEVSPAPAKIDELRANTVEM